MDVTSRKDIMKRMTALAAKKSAWPTNFADEAFFETLNAQLRVSNVLLIGAELTPGARTLFDLDLIVVPCYHGAHFYLFVYHVETATFGWVRVGAC